jgi:hypothetical protein
MRMDAAAHRAAADKALDGEHFALAKAAQATRLQKNTSDRIFAVARAREMSAWRALAKTFGALAAHHLGKADDMSAPGDKADEARASALAHSEGAADAKVAERRHTRREIDHGKDGDANIARAHARLAEGHGAIAASENALADAFREHARLCRDRTDAA